MQRAEADQKINWIALCGLSYQRFTNEVDCPDGRPFLRFIMCKAAYETVFVELAVVLVIA